MNAGPKPDSTARGAAFSLLGNAASLIINLLLARVLARSLGPELKGGYDTLIATTAIGATTFSLCLYSGVNYVVARNPKAKTRKLAEILIGVSLLQGLVALAVLFGLSRTPLRDAFVPPGYGAFAPVAAAIGITTCILVGNFRAFLSGWRLLVAASGVDLSVRALTLALVWLVLRHPVGHFKLDRLAILATISASLIVFVGLLIFAFPLTRREGDDLDANKIVRYSLANLVGSVLYDLNLRLAIFMLLFYTNTEKVAIFAVGLQTAQVVWLPSIALQMAIFPRMAGIHDEAHLASLFARALRVNAVVVVAVTLAFVLVAPAGMPWLFGPKFHASTGLALAMAPAAALSALGNNVSSSLNNARGNPHFNGYGSALGLIISLVVGVVAIPRLGVVGAAIAVSASYIASAAFMFFAANSQCRVPANELLRLRRSDFVEIEAAFKRLLRAAKLTSKG